MQPQRQLRSQLVPTQVDHRMAAAPAARAQNLTTIYEVEVAAVISISPPWSAPWSRAAGFPGRVVRPLHAQDLPAVLRLHGAFRCDADRAWLRLAGLARDESYCRARSVVLAVADGAIGALLVQAEATPDRAFVYGVVVDARWRHTWAAAYLKHRALVQLKACGTDVVRFEASAASRDTHKHAARVGAWVVGHRPNP